jgi:hypothetical protein
MLETPASELLNVTALNLFRPTASPPFHKVSLFHITTQSLEGEGGADVTLFNAFVLVYRSSSSYFFMKSLDII